MAFHMLQFESLFLPSSHFDYFLEVHNSSKDFGRKRLWLSGQGTQSSSSQVPGSVPCGNEFSDWVKKNPLTSPHAKALVKALPSCAWHSHGTVALV
jgi:hypothetical protein